jgi:S1-C subfamily serine protease
MRLGVAMVVGFAAAHGLTARAATAQAVPAPPRAVTLAEVSASFEALAAQVSASTVQVLASGLIADPDQLPPDGPAERRRASGSGVILDASGYVMTNYHVIQGARRVQVVLPSRPPGTSFVRPRGKTLDATVVGVDEETDLALLRVSGAVLAPLPLGDSSARVSSCLPSAARSASTTP